MVFVMDRTDEEEQRETVWAVICEYGRMARIAEVCNTLQDLQEIVMGMIEIYYPFDENVCIVCNEEGKLNGMLPNRAIIDEDRNIKDIIFGPFLICGYGGGQLTDLTGEQLEKYFRMFRYPECFIREDGAVKAVPYIPAADVSRQR